MVKHRPPRADMDKPTCADFPVIPVRIVPVEINQYTSLEQFTRLLLI
jgi:hypothetical protein